MLLDTTLYKSLSWSFMELIRSLELYCLGIRIQRQKIITFLGQEQTIYGLTLSCIMLQDKVCLTILGHYALKD